MANGILSRFPDLSRVGDLSASVESGLGGLQGALGGVDSGGGGSPLAAVAGAITTLSQRADIDLSGLTERLPAAMSTIRNALPADSLRFIEAIEQGYGAAQDFLQNSALVREVRGGGSLQDVALAVVAEVLQLFSEHLDQLGGGLIDGEILTQVRETFEQIDRLRNDFAGHSGELLPFVARNLVGVAPDLLSAPLAYATSALAVLDPLQPAALAARTGTAQQALALALEDLGSALETFDPGLSGAYATLLARLDSVEGAVDGMLDVLQPLYAELGTLASTHPWSTLFTVYRDLLQAVSLERIPSADDVIDEIAAAMERLLSGLSRVFGVQDLSGRIEGLGRSLRETFLNSPLGQVRRSVQEFLGDIRDAIEGVPTEEIQQAVEQMLQQVRQQLEDLGITQIRTSIESAFQELETFVTTTFNGTLTQEVRDAVRDLLAQLQGLDVGGLIDEVTQAVEGLDGLIGEAETQLNGLMDDFTSLVSQLDELSFEPVADEVIEEIDDLKSRLSAINPDSLSDVEKLAIRAALAILEAIDLEGMINGQLKQGFSAAAAGVKGVLGEITAALERLKDNCGDFDPRQVLEPVNLALETVVQGVERLNARVLLQPFYELLDGLIARLESLSPGSLLDPLQGPYAEMMAMVNRINPSTWVAPLRALYAEIDRLISVVDITPLMETLEQRRLQLFAEARTSVLDALAGVHLPAPLDGFFDGVRAAVEAMTDAIFGDPDGELRRISIDLRARFRLSSLFEPLDAIFDQLVSMAESVPVDALTQAFNSMRGALGTGLERLEPRRVVDALRSGEGELRGVSPALLLAGVLRLPALKASFQARAAAAPSERAGDVAAVVARFNDVLSSADPGIPGSRMSLAFQAHAGALESLTSGLRSADASAAEAAYGRLRQSLDRLVPAFLRRPQPLTHEEVLAGLRSMRPSSKASRLDRVMDDFLRQLAPLETALEPAVNGFFGSLREVVNLVNPLTLKDDVASIYAAIRAKVRVLDPDDLETSLRTNVYEPIVDPLRAIDPADLKARLNGVYTQAITAVRNQVRGILDDIASAVDEVFRELREAIEALVQTIRQAVTDLMATVERVLGRLEDLVFVELLERLNRGVDNLAGSFDRELDRVRNAFDAMLAAIPLGGSPAAASVSA